MSIACKICIMEQGLLGSDLDSLPKTQEELEEHIEREHHIAVRRKGETGPQAVARLQRTYPESVDPATCKCPECKRKRNPVLLSMWTIYDRPSDYPQGFIARRHEVRSDKTIIATADVLTAQNIDALRVRFENEGFTCLTREVADDPKIVESWL